MLDNTHSFRFFNRGPSPMARLVFFAMLSLLLMFIDARYRYLESARGTLSVIVAPIQALATLPGRIWNQVGDYFSAQSDLKNQNQLLGRQHLGDAAQLAQLQSLQAENQQLRKLAALSARATYSSQLAEVIYIERDLFKRKIIVNKGADAHLQAGQVVMDDEGIVGQITRVYPWLSEVTLITEKDHVVPVQVLRNGLRTIIFGAGDTSQLTLRYMPISADLVEGDVLVTSGIDGIYPAGIPVAKVTRIERDAAYPFARVTCLPVGGVDKHRHLLILSSLPKLPELPATEPGSEDGKNPKARRKK
ncbi:MAG: rod shape-determining protein MreC [Gallionella sp.]|jgi:rod shape-determining protein MreC|nr:rod shape-determining protein MreC [Gallionella sp.]